MSTYAYTKVFVFDNKNNIISSSKDIDVNYMKNCLLGSDWPDEFDGYNPDLPVDITIDDIGYIKKDLLKDENVAHYIISEQDKEPVIINDWFDISTYKSEGKIVSNVSDTDILSGDWVKLKRKNSNYNIIWVTPGILATYADKLVEKLHNFYENLFKKNLLKDSLDYYKLEDDAKESLNDDISYIEEDIELRNNELQAVYQLNGLLDGYKELNHKSWEDNVAAVLFLC